MKKIININLSGRVIPIEDSAYEKLQAYIESLRRYFSNEEGRDEIINDIESRIAELMSEKVRKGASSITDADVNEIAASMGRPEDFEAEAASDAGTNASTNTTQQSQGQQQQQQQQTYTERRTSKGRLYRDTNDKFIGGVCSGIAAYLNVDPAIVRILFAIITFGGFGLGFLAYILLWMILPPKNLEGSYTGKRLYRNPDDRIIGGVAGGLAAYFNRSVTSIRLIFAAPLLLSVLIGVLDGFTGGGHFDFFPNIISGSLSGTFFLAYVILWMVLPEAHSTYEKMEMRGEKVDVNSIRQNVKDGMDNMKERMKGFSDEVKESAQNFSSRVKDFSNTTGKAFATELSQTARRGSNGLGHAIGVIFKVFFLFIAGTIAFALFVAVIALIFGGVAWWPINNFLWTSKWQQIYAWGTLIFFLGVPLIGFIIWIIRRILRVRSQSNYLSWTFGFLWTIGWVSGVLFAASITKDFREHEHKDTAIDINQPLHGKMIVAVSQPELEYTGSFDWINDSEGGWDLTSDTLKLSTVKFNVIASADSFYHVTVKRYSFGKTREDALDRAGRIQYNVSWRDSVLDLANGYTVDRTSKFRGQQVEIEIQVPVGKKLRFDQSVDDKLNPTDIIVKRKYRRNKGVSIEVNDEYWHRFRSNIDYVMGVDGSLKDSEGKTINSGDYRYDDNSNSKKTDSADIQRQINEEKRIKEESERKIKELEEKKNKPTASAGETMDDKEELSATGNNSSSPAISLLSWMY